MIDIFLFLLSPLLLPSLNAFLRFNKSFFISVIQMGRNKKKTKTAVEDSEDDEEIQNVEKENGVEVQSTEDLPQADDSDSESENPQKKKAYKRKGGDESKEQGKKGKKGDRKKQEVAQDESGANVAEESETLVITREYPMEVLYCPICTFPAEMCEFSGMLEKCRPWLEEHAAEFSSAAERGRRRRILTEQGRLERLLEGGGKHAISKIVVVESAHSAKRAITVVTGMEYFGFNLKDISREWKKKFSCGVGVKDADELNPQSRVEIQGNVVDTLCNLLISHYKIPKESLFEAVKEGKSKKNVLYFDE